MSRWKSISCIIKSFYVDYGSCSFCSVSSLSSPLLFLSTSPSPLSLYHLLLSLPGLHRSRFCWRFLPAKGKSIPAADSVCNFVLGVFLFIWLLFREIAQQYQKNNQTLQLIAYYSLKETDNWLSCLKFVAVLPCWMFKSFLGKWLRYNN